MTLKQYTLVCGFVCAMSLTLGLTLPVRGEGAAVFALLTGFTGMATMQGMRLLVDESHAR